MLYANGMGPIKDKNVKRVGKVLNKTDLITLRENVSLEEIRRCNITKPKVVVTADPAFNLVASDETRADKILADYSIDKEASIVAVSVRESHNIPENFEEELAKTLDEVSKNGYLPVFIPMQRSLDLDMSFRIASKMKEQSRVIDCSLSVCDMLALIGKCSVACGMRLHMLIFASVMNVPMAGVAYDPKIKGFMEYMHQKHYVDLKDFKFESFRKVLNEVLENAEALRNQLEEKLIPLRNKAKENAFLAVELLGK